MCCDKGKNEMQTPIQGAMGSPVGFEVNDFMNPGGAFGSDDVLGAIYAKLGLEEEPEMEGAGTEMMARPRKVR